MQAKFCKMYSLENLMWFKKKKKKRLLEQARDWLGQYVTCHTVEGTKEHSEPAKSARKQLQWEREREREHCLGIACVYVSAKDH